VIAEYGEGVVKLGGRILQMISIMISIKLGERGLPA